MTRAEFLQYIAAGGIYFDDDRLMPVRVERPRFLQISGGNSAIGNKIEGMWANGGLLGYPKATGEQIKVLSTSASDTVSGIGLQVIRCHYVRADFSVGYEDIDMNGMLMATSTATDIIRVLNPQCVQFGSSNRCEGNVAIKGVSSGNTLEAILTGTRAPQTAKFYVRPGYSAFLLGWSAQVDTSDMASFMFMHNWDRATRTHLTTAITKRWVNTSDNQITIDSTLFEPVALPEYTDIEFNAIRSLAAASDAVGHVTAEIALCKNL